MTQFTFKHQWKLALTGAAALIAASCTKMPSEEYDPWEPFNRGMYQVNYVIDGVVLKPVTQVYRWVMPEQGEKMVHNFVLNLYEPINFGNSVLQGDPQNSFVSLWRFLLNSTVGLGGLFDVASDVGLVGRRTDFGQTLALYGVEDGPFLFLPILGPSGVRDGVGRIGDFFMYPPTYIGNDAVSWSMWGVTLVDTRSQNWDLINDVEKTSLDPYATFRSGYKQRRANEISKARAARNAAWEKAKAAR